MDQIENSVKYTAAGQTPYFPEQVVAVAYQLVFQTGLFLDNCKIWHRKEPADKTWTAFKVFFTNYHQEWRESQVTTAGAGFQTANAAIYHQDTVEAISNRVAMIIGTGGDTPHMLVHVIKHVRVATKYTGTK